MRAAKHVLLALTIAVLASAFAAGTASADPPVLTNQAPTAITTTSVTFNGTINTGGILSIPRVYYFPAVATTNCSSPDAGEAAGAAYVSEGGLHTTTNTDAIQVTIGGLAIGTTYCWRWSAVNYPGQTSVTPWSSVTTLNGPNAPGVDFTGSGGTAHSISMSGEVTTHGLDWSYHFDYFPIGTTTNCNFPSQADLANVQSTGTVSSTVHDPIVPVSGSASSLPAEKDFCTRLVAKNADGTNATLFWSTFTMSDPLALTDVAFDNGSTSINYTANFTANTNLYIGYIQVEYFKKTAAACADYTGSVTTVQYFGDDFSGWSGNTPQAVASSVTGLQTDTTYCIRLVGVGPNASVPSAWSVVTTVQPRPITIDNVKLGPSTTGHSADITFGLDDRGAADDTGDPSTYSVYVFDVGAGRCTDSDYFGGAQLVDLNNVNFNGTKNVRIPLDGLTLGKPYCVTIVADSAWGGDYDAGGHFETWFGQSPSLSASSLSLSNYTNVSTTSSVLAGYLATQYSAEYFGKQSGVECADDTTSQRYTEFGGTATTGLDGPQLLSVPANGLPSATTLCFRMIVSNYWGSAASAFQEVTTGTMPVDPTISGLQFGAAPNGAGARISANVDDNGAAGDTGDVNSYALKIFALPTGVDCDAAGVVGRTALYDESQSFIGNDSLFDHVPGLGPGSTYCAAVTVTSAWGGHAASDYLSFVMAAPPGFGTSAPVVGANSVQISGTLSPTWTDTTYKLEWINYDDTLGCESGTPQSLGAGTTTGSASASATQVSITVLALQPEQKICTRLSADNAFGASSTQWEVSTTLEVTPPSIPTGLTSSNVTQTSATLNWTASTDNVGVTGYSILSGGGVIGTSSGTSFDVTLTCGVAKTFTVTAHDAQNNTSDPSTSLTVTGAACPVVTPPDQTPAGGGNTTPPPPKQCFQPYSKTLKGKIGKKKYAIKITGTPSSDGQSATVKLKTTGGVVAAIVIAKKKLGKQVVVKSPTGVTVTYKVGKKIKTLKLGLTISAAGC
jgi:hypothetical protein